MGEVRFEGNVCRRGEVWVMLYISYHGRTSELQNSPPCLRRFRIHPLVLMCMRPSVRLPEIARVRTG